MGQVHPFGGHRGSNHRHSQRHALIDLTLHARPKTQRSDRELDMVKERTNIRLEARDNNILLRQSYDFWRCFVADNIKLRAQLVPDKWEYLLGKENNRID